MTLIPNSWYIVHSIPYDITWNWIVKVKCIHGVHIISYEYSRMTGDKPNGIIVDEDRIFGKYLR